MNRPELRAAGLIIAGAIMGLLFILGWAAAQLAPRDWIGIAILSACFAALLYGRTWLRRLFGLTRPRHMPHGTRFLRLDPTRPIANDRAPHPTRKPSHL